MKNNVLNLGTILLCSLTINVMSQNIDSVTNSHDELIREADVEIANYKFENALKILAKGDSLSKGILLRIGQCNVRLGASRDAIRPFERVLQMDSTNLHALGQLGQLYAQAGEFRKALSSFLRLIKIDSSNSYYHKQAGSMALRLEDKVGAKQWFKKTLALNPADTEASVALGNIQLEMQEYKSVDSIVQQALSIEPQFIPLLLLQAKSAFEQQQYESVIIIVNKVLERSDTTALSARLLGVSYFNIQKYPEVASCMYFLLKNRYEYEWVYHYMGVVSRELGDTPSSIKWFKMAIQKSLSKNTEIYYSQLGKSYEEMGDYKGAIRAYRAAYNYSMEGIFLYHLARNYDVYYEDKGTALLYYQKYLESDDTIRVARKYALERLQDAGRF